MKTITINWAMIGAMVAALAGIAGSIITPIYGTSLATSVQAALQSISGLLVLIPTWHIASTAAYTSKLRASNVYRPTGNLGPAPVPGGPTL